jgi:(p)ppGpp synthase/HD superfamily hydrolase
VELPTEIRVDLGNQRGVLATVAAAIAEMGSNIENVRSQERDGTSSTISFLINVHGRGHLASIMRRLRALGPVLRIVRVAH